MEGTYLLILKIDFEGDTIIGNYSNQWSALKRLVKMVEEDGGLGAVTQRDHRYDVQYYEFSNKIKV